MVASLPNPARLQQAARFLLYVLHWDGTSWTRETIEVPAAGSTSFEVLAISASSPENAWLLGRMEGSSGPLALFRRHAGATPQWRRWNAVRRLVWSPA